MPKMSPAILLAISLILICATILSPSGAVGQSISVAAVGPTRVDFGPLRYLIAEDRDPHPAPSVASSAQSRSVLPSGPLRHCTMCLGTALPQEGRSGRLVWRASCPIEIPLDSLACSSNTVQN